MNLPQIPALPGWLTGLLAAVAFVLGTVAPTLNSPWQEVVVAVLAVLSWLGIRTSNSAVRAHRDAVADHVAKHLQDAA